MEITTLLFDLDGTLLDTHYAHARAYEKAFHTFEYDVPVDEIVRLIGMGGDRLVPQLIGEEAYDAFGDAIRECKDAVFDHIIQEEGARVLSGTVELLDAVRARGIKTAIATGSKSEALEAMMEGAGIDFAEHVDIITTASDVEHSKPHPATPMAALEKLNAHASEAVMLGDTPFDAEAALRAGVAPVGILTGVYSREELLQAGMSAVYADANEVREHLDEILSAPAASERRAIQT